MTDAVRVLGLDLSLTATGVSDGWATSVIRSTGNADATLDQRLKRIEQIATEINRSKGTLSTLSLVVVEGPSLGSRTGHAHDRSGLWWMVVSMFSLYGFSVVEVPPASLKLFATGKGNADKGAIIEAATRRFPDVETGGHDGRCDALWLAAIGYQHLGHPIVTVPQRHHDALTKVRWPEVIR